MRAMILRNALLAVLGVALIPGGQALANHVSCGQTITQDTTLDSDLVNCPARGLVLGADGVDLDLAGHTISGTGSAFFGIEARVRSGLSVHDGTVTGFDSFGVLLSDVTDSEVTRLAVTAHFNGIWFSGNSDRNHIQRNTITALDGIEMNDDADANVIAHNSITAGIEGIDLEYDFRNRQQFNRIEHNHSTSGFRVVGNDDLVIAHNVINDGFQGMVVGEGSRILISKNTVSGTGQGMILFHADDSLVEKNVVSDNTIDGIVMFNSEGAILNHNVASRNGEFGIQVLTFEPFPDPHTLVHNVANDNGILGIAALPTTIDGGHNRASGNGDPRQCVNVVCK